MNILELLSASDLVTKNTILARTKSYLTSYQHISTILGLLEIRSDSLSSLGSEGNVRVLTKLESEESSRTFGVLGATESGPILLAPKQAE